MIRVYFDLNVFSDLRKEGGLKEPYKTILSILVRNKERILCPYSSAHILDLKKSLETVRGTELANSELEFIQSVSGKHCLAINAKKVMQ